MSGHLCGDGKCVEISDLEMEAMGIAIEQERLRQPDGLIPDLDDPFWNRVHAAKELILVRLQNEQREMEPNRRRRRRR